MSNNSDAFTGFPGWNGETPNTPRPGWAIEEYLEQLVHMAAVLALPPVTEENNGDFMTVVDGEWAPSDVALDEKITADVNEWLEDHPEATTTVQDGAITRAKLDSALQAATDVVPALAFGAEGIDFTNATVYNVLIGSGTNKWNGTSPNASYFVPIPAGISKIAITAGENKCVYALLADESHTSGQTPNYATGESRKEIDSGESAVVDVPDDALYICICKTASQGDFTPQSAAFLSITWELGNQIASIESDREEELVGKGNNLWKYGDISYGQALNQNTGVPYTQSAHDTTDFIPVGKFSKIIGKGARYWFYDSSKNIIAGSTGILKTNPETYTGSGYYMVDVPADAVYFRLSQLNTEEKELYAPTAYDDYLERLITGPTKKLYCLGDSITRGMYAEYGASSSSGPTAYGYPYWLGKANGYTVVNLGNSGSGWAEKGSTEIIDNQSVNRNAKDVVDDNTFSDADIITLAFGVNDWKGADQSVVLGDMTSTAGDGTVVGNMKYCIQQISTKKPTAQIIVLLPLNTNRQWTGMDTMTEANNWAFGYAYRNNQTLEDYRDAIRTCAEYYNVKVVDLEEVCPINRLNIRSVCGDGLHPTQAFYKQMGQALAPLIH